REFQAAAEIDCVKIDRATTESKLTRQQPASRHRRELAAKGFADALVPFPRSRPADARAWQRPAGRFGPEFQRCAARRYREHRPELSDCASGSARRGDDRTVEAPVSGG